MSQCDQAVEKLDGLKEDLREIEGVGKDVLLRVHAAIDDAKRAILSSRVAPHHDLNDELAESPEDHPREQGNEHPSVSEQESADPQEKVQERGQWEPSAEEQHVNPALAAQTEPAERQAD